MECPLCLEKLDIDDHTFFPCSCGYQICRFCWHRLKTNNDNDLNSNMCPACRAPYSDHPANFKPITTQEMIKFKSNEKKKKTNNKSNLAELRVVQKNLIFVVGLSTRIGDSDILKKNEYFGKFGKILKVVVNNCGQGTSAYITYLRSEDALRAITSVNNVPFDGKTIKVNLGTTKYCSHFLKNQACPKSECMYLHSVGDPEASFTKEDMQAGKHIEFEKKLVEEFLRAKGELHKDERKEHKVIQKEEHVVNRKPPTPTPTPTPPLDRPSRTPTPPPSMEETVLQKEMPPPTPSPEPDDIGFDPFHETQKAFEELIKSEATQMVNSSSAMGSSYNNYHGFTNGFYSQQQQQQLHLQQQQQHQLGNFYQQQQQQHHQIGLFPLQQQPQPHQIHHQYFNNISQPPPGYNNNIDSWSSLDPAIIFTSRQQMLQQQQRGQPGPPPGLQPPPGFYY